MDAHGGDAEAGAGGDVCPWRLFASSGVPGGAQHHAGLFVPTISEEPDCALRMLIAHLGKVH